MAKDFQHNKTLTEGLTGAVLEEPWGPGIAAEPQQRRSEAVEHASEGQECQYRKRAASMVRAGRPPFLYC